MQELFTCVACDAKTKNFNMVCDSCFRDHETNNCMECGKHLTGIPYEYVCGDCIRHPKDKVIKCEAPYCEELATWATSYLGNANLCDNHLTGIPITRRKPINQEKK